MVYNTPRDQTGWKELKGHVRSDQINFSMGKSKIKHFLERFI